MILAVEPLCHGHEHARVNAALLHAFRMAFPDEPIHFLSEAGHGEAVFAHLREQGAGPITRSDLKRVRHRDDSSLSARAGELFFCRYLLKQAKARQACLLLLTAVNTPILFFLNTGLQLSSYPLRVVAMAHSLMQNLTLEPASLLTRWMGLRRTLAGLDARRIRVLVPGDSVLGAAQRRAPEAAGALASLDLCYDFPANVPPSPPLTPPLRFGFLGVATRRKGIDSFYRLAGATEPSLASFVVIGLLQDRPGTGLDSRRVEVPCPDRFLEPAERTALLDRLHYAVFPYQPAEYELVASAAFLDALAARKPVIALRNPYFALQFQRMGDIGYLCDTEEELIATVRELARQPDPDRYARQQARLDAGCRFFRVEEQASRLRALLALFRIHPGEPR